MLSKKKLRKVNIIAEIGVNHNGSLTLAKKLVKIAKKSGADFVKFQMYNCDELVTDTALKAKYQTKSMGKKISQKLMLKKYHLKYSQLIKIYQYCQKIGIKFSASVFDETSLENLKKFKVDFIKIPSSEITNIFLLNKIKDFKDIPIIFSTGMSSISEISYFKNYLKNKKNFIIPLYCISSYPTKIEEFDIKKFRLIKKKFKTIGFSDHTNSNLATIISILNGSRIIEKHLTFDNNAEGPDHSSSLNPENFKNFVLSIRDAEKIYNNKKIYSDEKKNIKFVRKFLVAKKNIKVGDKFSYGNITAKRTGKIGFEPSYFLKINGKKSKKNFRKDEMIYL